MDYGFIFIILAVVFGLFMTWGVGANDLSNVLSTAMGSKALSVRQALIIAIIFECAGAFLASGSVTHTIRHGIINMDVLNNDPQTLVLGMLAVMLGGSCWMTIASFFGLPVSITNTIIGSIVGFGSVVIGVHAVHWKMVAIIACGWVISPMISGVVAYIIFLSIQKFILTTPTPFKSAKRRVPYYFFLIGFILSVATILKGLKHFGIYFSRSQSVGISIVIGLFVMLLGIIFIRRINIVGKISRHEEYARIEKIFAVLMLFTACAMVFAHGSNDVANAVGPMSIIICLVKNGGHMASNAPQILWVLALGCFGIIVGLLTYGRKVIATVGSGITALTPSRAFAATMSAACTAVIATSAGIPISTTQILVGGVLGVGMARGIGALNLRVIRNIFLSWFITIPLGALFTIIFYYIFRLFF